MEKKLKSKCGIYKITNMVNGKIRIGHTKGDFQKRFSVYKALLRHNNCDIKEMQEDWNLYGEESFSFEPIENFKIDELLEVENYYMLTYNTIETGYNDNLNDLNTKKKVRRGKEAAKYREFRSQITSGENNGNHKLTKKQVFNILTLYYIKNVDSKEIAEEFNLCSYSYVSRLGKDRWCRAFNEWQEIHKSELLN